MISIFAQSFRVASRETRWSDARDTSPESAHDAALPAHWRRKMEEEKRQQEIQDRMRQMQDKYRL